MDASGEEGTGTGKLKPGLRTVAGVVTEETHAALLALRRERGIATISKAVGEALREWAGLREADGFKPEAAADRVEGTPGGGPSLRPAETREVTLSPWQEVRGRVRMVAEDGPRVQISLENENGGDEMGIRLPGPRREPELRVGARVAILRTDEPGREYIVRTLD